MYWKIFKLIKKKCIYLCCSIKVSSNIVSLLSQLAVVAGLPHHGSVIKRMHHLAILVQWGAPDAGVGFPALLAHQGNHHLPAILHSVEYLPPNAGQGQSLVSVLTLHFMYFPSQS